MEVNEIVENIEKIKKDAFVHTRNSWGLRTPGENGYIVTKDGELYSYQLYKRVPESMKEFCKNYFKKEKNVSEQFMKEINNYFEENINGKEFPYVKIYDASFIVEMKGVVIENHTEIYKGVEEIIRAERKRN